MKFSAAAVLLAVTLISWTLIYEDAFGDLTLAFFMLGCCFIAISKTVSYNNNATLQLGIQASTPPLWSAFSKLWVFVVLSWVYGVTLGFIYGNPSSNIVRNFFGLTLYIFTPLFLSARLSTKSLINCLAAGGCIQALWGFYAIASTGGLRQKLEVGGLADFRSIYSTGFLVIFPLFSIIVAANLFPRQQLNPVLSDSLLKILRNPLSLIAITFALIVPAMSKGFVLAAVLIGGLIGCAAGVSILERLRIGVPALATFLMISLTAAVAAPIAWPLLNDSFAGHEVSNAVRGEQVSFIAAETSWLGKGLGARLTSGYARDEAGYGFELTYLNIIHKLGIASLPLFVLYGGTVIFALHLVFSRAHRVEGAAALGAMAYLIVGIGNPVLLSATAVALHLVALALIQNSYYPES